MANLIVTNTNDSGSGSLRETIATAPADALITFAHNLANQTITLTSGQLVVNKNLIIDGAQAPGLTISGNNASRVIEMENGINFTLKNVTIANGKVTGADEATGSGGGLRGSSNSTLNLEYCTFKNNVASWAGAIYTGFKSINIINNCTFDNNNGTSGKSERGAGAIGTKSAGSLTVKASTFTNNKGINGGAINSVLGILTVDSCIFTNNDTLAGVFGTRTIGYGGAIYTDGANASGPNSSHGPVGGKITISNSRFDGNKGAGQGGALFLFVYPPDTILVEGCQISNNQVVKDAKGDALGGGLRIGNGEYTISKTKFIQNTALSQGGAFWVGETSPGTIIDSTFSGNQAYEITADGKSNGLGGAIVLVSGNPVKITNCVITQNHAGFQGGAFWGGGEHITLTNSIVAYNKAENGGKPWNVKHHTGAQFNDGGGNIQWPAKNPNDPNDLNITKTVTIAEPKL